ncbi:hypothetical protein [Bacillus arachidis]|uniref:Uncharacterized protein n=1 Tax=Bacillus arachidis TaxID=2819290 RepID=A0ABS3P497_9BACI|nr:hypothetical protein [Bacillus arachidis]MBO1627587.1 hypothetical protein [Bacillus arachidis]
MLSLKKLLTMHGLDCTRTNIKLIRHKDSRINLAELYEKGEFELYQQHQDKDVFKNCKYIVSFLGIDGSKAKFIGVYEVISTQAVSDFQCTVKLDWMAPEIGKGNNFYYNLTPLSKFNDLKERLVIDWGKVH